MSVGPVSTSSRLSNIPLFELSRSQTIQLICVFIGPKLRLVGYLVGIVIPRYLGIVCKMSSFFTRPKTRTMRKRWAKYLELISQGRVSSFEVESRADEDAICNFGSISQIRNSVLFGNLELMKTRFVTLGLFPKSEIACYLAISRWWRRT